MALRGRNKLLQWWADLRAQSLAGALERVWEGGLLEPAGLNSLFLIINKNHFRILPSPYFTLELHTHFTFPPHF